ncbi:AfsR/SARP family transcriptional regulator [Streptomyces sp. TR06-5]|uniref:AfsR/SARP family transcriptional regulator n=1 Tax=Streptomyces sp. TR06-5 TaxID=3385976 RepID=UPI0039A0E13B
MGADVHRTHGTEPRDRLRFHVLGPVLAWRGGTALPTGSPQQKALLAALLLRAGRTVTAEHLMDGLWGEDPPDRAKSALRTYASRLRKALGEDAAHLVSESGGYALRTADAGAVLDLDLAADHAARAEASEAAGDLAGARDAYAAALAQWSGESLAHVPGPYAGTQRARLEEWRLGLAERGLDLSLRTGLHTEAVSELTALTAAYPLRERLRELLMLALYRSGRQAEALAVYADTRKLLGEELGVDPRPELSELQQRILEADEDLALASDGSPSAPHGHEIARPAQLPATVADFTGRTALVAELGRQLGTAEGSVMAVSAVAGIGGVGKTTLAVHVAQAARAHFPDGQLYVDLQGAGQAVEPEAVLGSFLRSLGTPDSTIPDGLQERSALFRSLLAGRRVLALLDNARDAAQVRPLLPGTAGCAALITSRTRMVDLAGAHLVDLDVMSPEEAITLFTRIVGEDRVRAERQAVMDVVAACGFLPLALRIAAARLASRRTWTVSFLAAKLADERRRLDELQVGDQAVKATFELGYSQLDPSQARAFRLLGLADGPDISLHAAAALLGRLPEDAEDVLESLVDTSLLESAAPGRYRFHDLVRLYARQCAERDEQPPSERDEALSRLLDFYLATGGNAFRMALPGERLADHVAGAREDGLAFADPAAAIDWLFAESPCFLACAQQLASGTTLRRAADLLMVTVALGEGGVNVRAHEQAALALRDAARREGDAQAEARARSVLTGLHMATGQFGHADEEARLAGLLGREAEDPVASSYSLNDRGIIANYQGRHADGERYLHQALESFRAYDNEPSVASALCNLARNQIGSGRTENAVALTEEAVVIYERHGMTMRLGNGHYALGLALTAAGRFDEARNALDKALEAFRTTRQRLWEGMAHVRLAEVHLPAGTATSAAGHAEQAQSILRGVGGPWRHAHALTVLGRALADIGQGSRARACWTEALSTYEELDSPEAADVRALLAPAAVA